MVTKQEFILVMKEKPDVEVLAKLDPFFNSEWKTEDDNKNNKTPLTHGEILIIPKNSTPKKFIIIEPVTNTNSNSMILILAEQGSKAKILVNKTSKEENNITNSIRVISHKDSFLEIIDVCMGEGQNVSNIITNLVESGAETRTTLLFLGKQEQEGEISTAALHNAPYTKSDIITRCIVSDKAKIKNKDMIRISKKAHNSIGYQKQDALLLNSEAKAEAIPNLEIHNNDVKCSHGSTIGQIDKEKLFYLMSRGLDEKSAKQKIVEGYFTPILEIFKDEELKQKINTTLVEGLQ